MTEREEEDLLYECECFRILRFIDEEGRANMMVSFFDHGMDLYMSDEEFSHFAEAVGGITIAPQSVLHH